MYVEKRPSRWDEHFPYMLANRSSAHDSTGYSPNMMMLGREAELPLQSVVPLPVEEGVENAVEYVQEMHNKMETAHENARAHLKKAAQHQKKNYDYRTTGDNKFVTGQAVWYYNPSLKIGHCHKINKSWKGPFVVTQVIDHVRYQIKLNLKTKPIVCHVDTLNKCEGDKPPTWYRD